MSEWAFLRCCLSTRRSEWETPHRITDPLCLTSSRNHPPRARTRTQSKLGSRFFPEQITNFSTLLFLAKKAISCFYPAPHRQIAARPLPPLLITKADLRRGSGYITDARDRVERDRTDFQGKTVLCKCLLCASADPSALITPFLSTWMLTTRVKGSRVTHSRITRRWSWTAPQLATAAELSRSCC